MKTMTTLSSSSLFSFLLLFFFWLSVTTAFTSTSSSRTLSETTRTTRTTTTSPPPKNVFLLTPQTKKTSYVGKSNHNTNCLYSSINSINDNGNDNDNIDNNKNYDKLSYDTNRRNLLTSSITKMMTTAAAVVAATAFVTKNPAIAAADAAEDTAMTKITTVPDGGDGVIMYKTGTGLKYIQLEKSTSDDATSNNTPRYGQLCVLSYTAYMKLPNAKEKVKFDTCSGYVIKHGNGRLIPGLDEGVHTMQIGELRRIIIPPKLGFVRSGLGPIPQYPWNRNKLNDLLEEMIEQRGGNLVYDVRLDNFFDDEADQGYYEDLELSAEQLDEINRRLVQRQPPSTIEPQAGQQQQEEGGIGGGAGGVI